MKKFILSLLFLAATAHAKAPVVYHPACSTGILNLATMNCLNASASSAWGSITGVLSDQTDLQSALDAKVNSADAVSTETAGKVVKRDGSAGFSAGVVKLLSSGIELGTQDSFSRNQVWNKLSSSILRLGSWGQDGDAANILSEGAVFYGDSLTGQPISGTDGGYARVKPNRFGLFSVDSTLPAYTGGDYYFRVDPTSLYLRGDSGAKTFEVSRATGQIDTSLSTGVLHADASGVLSSSAVALGSDVSGLLPVANQVSQPTTQVIYIDKNRVDSYTEDGSITRPYKTIKAAVDASTCTAAALCLFKPAPGSYVENNALSFKEWQYVDGVQRDLVKIQHADASAIVVDFTANASHRAGFSNLTFVNGLTVDRTGDTTGGASLDMTNVWINGAFSDVGVGSGRDYLNLKHCSISGAATVSGVSGILNWSNFYSTLDLGTTGASYADVYGYYALVTFEGSYIAGNLSATADTAKPAGYQTFHTNGDGNWSFVGTAAIDYYTDTSGPVVGASFTKTNVTTYRYGHLENMQYTPAATNWAGSAPTNVHDALERMAALLKTLNGGTAIP